MLRKHFRFHTLFPPLLAIALHSIGALLFTENAGAFTALGLAIWMVYWWVEGTISLGVTALVPLVFIPLSGLAPLEAVSTRYANPIIFLFLGGFILAITLEKYGIHTFMAQRIIRIMGFNARQRINAMLFTSAILSMWISNTATALIMLPIAVSFSSRAESIIETNHRFHHRLFLAIAAGANIGGIATLVGTPPNLFFAAFLHSEMGIEVAFFEWMMVGLPLSIALLLIAKYLLEQGIEQNLMIPQTIESTKLDRNQKNVLLVFGLVAFFWIFKPLFGSLVNEVHDAVIAFAGILLLQLIPQAGKSIPMIDWKDIQKLPWDIVLLFGGGLSLAMALQTGGVFEYLGSATQILEGKHIIIAIIVFSVIGIFLTEAMSNIAMVAVLLPFLMEISNASNLSFFAIALPLVIGASCAFMLPIATPPNAIVFGAKKISVVQMMRFGIRMNLAALVFISATVFALFYIGLI